MGINNYITDSKNNKSVHVVTHDDKDNSNALVIATHPLKKYIENTIFFSNDAFGINLAIPAGANGGTPELIYDENIEWLTSSVVGGGWVFTQTAVGSISPHSGSIMLDATGTTHNDTMQFFNGDNLNLSTYDSITGWIYVTAWPVLGTKAINLLGWMSTGGIQVGVTVDIGTYIDIGLTNSWQKFTIPLGDMSLIGETIDALRITTIDLGGGSAPDYYLDEIEIQETPTGDAISSTIFSIEPDIETWMHIDSFTFFFADDDFSTILADSTMPNIPYDSLLGIGPLSNGLVYNRFNEDEIIVTETINQFSDLIRLPSTVVSGYGGTKTPGGSWVSVVSPVAEPIILKPENKDKIRWVVSEDLSGLDLLYISAKTKLEIRT